MNDNKDTAAQPLDLDKLEALARKAYLANEVVAMIPPAKILDLIAQSRASQPEGATGTTGASIAEDNVFCRLLLEFRETDFNAAQKRAEIVARVDAIIGDLRAQLAAKCEDADAWSERWLKEKHLAAKGQGEPVPFRLGNEYQTQAGEWVRFVKIHNEGTSYETMEDQHGHNRYTRRDFGRCTGTAHDYSDPGNTPPLYLAAPASAQPDRGAAHAQQEAAPAEVTKSQERDYNWLLGLAKSKGYHTVYGALYAAPTAVPYLGILPSHSEREAANAGGLPVDLIHDFRDAINIAHHRADHAGDTTRMKRWKEVSRRLEAYVKNINAPATIAAGQEAANAKDAARDMMLWLSDDPEVYANGPDDFANDYAANCMAVGDDVTVDVDCAHRLPRRALRIAVVPKGEDDDAEVVWKWVERAAMAAVGAAGQEGVSE